MPTLIDFEKITCEEYLYAGENGTMYICRFVHHSRDVNGHMLIYGTASEHPHKFRFSNISMLCYKSNDYIDNPKLYPYKNISHKSIFLIIFHLQEPAIVVFSNKN